MKDERDALDHRGGRIPSVEEAWFAVNAGMSTLILVQHSVMYAGTHATIVKLVSAPA